jgi:ABC-2 type transport system ATP-binding protein
MPVSELLDVRGLRKSYGQTLALAGVDLQVARGETVALLGPNGAGKTTLVSIVAGLRRPDAGTVTVAGVDVVAEPRRAREKLGFAPQDTGVYPTLSCADNLRLFAGLAGIGRRQVGAAIDRVATALGLTHLLSRRAAQLSGGERRRLHTAIALIHRPALVLLDEPTVGADVQTRSALLELVHDLGAEGSGIVYSTHYMGEVEQLGASVVIIDRGQVIAHGQVNELIEAYAASIVELTFAGPAPALVETPLAATVEVDGNRIRVRTAAPGAAAATILHSLGPHASELRSIEIAQPSLETVFVSLTGHRSSAGEEHEVVSVA